MITSNELLQEFELKPGLVLIEPAAGPESVGLIQMSEAHQGRDLQTHGRIVKMDEDDRDWGFVPGDYAVYRRWAGSDLYTKDGKVLSLVRCEDVEAIWE